MAAKKEELLREASDCLVQFLMNGDLGPYVKDLEPGLNINSLEKLLKIHFVITRSHGESIGVVDFVTALPKRLRKIKTSVESRPDVLEGEVRGRIDWSRTISERGRKGSASRSIFVCREVEKDFQISENLVLKELLLTVQGILKGEAAQAIREGHDWISAWTGKDHLADSLNELMAKNIYLKRIDLTTGTADESMICRSLKSRNPLYREAGMLLRRYRRLASMKLDEQEAMEVLRSTFIVPGRDSVLFELYCASRIVKQMPDVTFHLIERGGNLIAEWSSGGYTYRLYHDSAGSLTIDKISQDLARHLNDGDNYFKRLLAARKKFEEMIGSTGEAAGRPDFVVERYDPCGSLGLVVVAEVKYTCDKNYASRGLKELLEYMALIYSPDGYLDSNQQLYTDAGIVRGILFTDCVPGFGPQNETVQTIQFGDNQTVRWLPKVAGNNACQPRNQ